MLKASVETICLLFTKYTCNLQCHAFFLHDFPEFCNIAHAHDNYKVLSISMVEFRYQDVFLLWETCWASRWFTTLHFEVFIGMAIIQQYK